jgi:hypothetical protein
MRKRQFSYTSLQNAHSVRCPHRYCYFIVSPSENVHCPLVLNTHVSLKRVGPIFLCVSKTGRANFSMMLITGIAGPSSVRAVRRLGCLHCLHLWCGRQFSGILGGNRLAQYQVCIPSRPPPRHRPQDDCDLDPHACMICEHFPGDAALSSGGTHLFGGP